MKRHDTPIDVAQELAKHAPSKVHRLLDPAVGSGALLKPFALNLRKQASKVVGIDIDRTAIADVKKSLGRLLPANVRFLEADFLKWSMGKAALFDCIVMNPPFAATKAKLCRIRISPDAENPSGRIRFMPLEAAFICRAIDLLQKNGRLLTVLPSSIVMSQSTQWLRDLLIQAGAIRFVHELPPKTFPNVEARMYLFVFDKASRQRRIVLFNHDLANPERLDLWLSGKVPVQRLDFGYHRAMEKLKQLMQFDRFGWQTLGDVASVVRGGIKSPIRSRVAVHSTNYLNGFWRKTHHRTTKCRQVERNIRNGDLLAMRVGRNCHKTFGRPVNLKGLPCSDCVMIIRPRKFSHSTPLLFSLQVLSEMEWSKPLIERGTGASYISMDSLRDLPIPMNLHGCFRKIFSQFVKAQNSKSNKKSRSAISSAANKLERIISTIV